MELRCGFFCKSGRARFSEENKKISSFVIRTQFIVYAKPVFEPSTMNVQNNPCYVVKRGPFQLELETLSMFQHRKRIFLVISRTRNGKRIILVLIELNLAQLQDPSLTRCALLHSDFKSSCPWQTSRIVCISTVTSREG